MRYSASAAIKLLPLLLSLTGTSSCMPYQGSVEADEPVTAAVAQSGEQRTAAPSVPVEPQPEVITARAVLSVPSRGDVRFAHVTPDGRRLVAGSAKQDLMFFDLHTGLIENVLQQQRGISCGTLSRDGKLLLTGGVGNEVYLWDMETQQQVAAVAIDKASPTSVAISPDRTHFAVGTGDGGITLFDSASFEKLQELPRQTMPVMGLEFSPDGLLLASATGNWREWKTQGHVRLWDTESGDQIASLPGTLHKMRWIHFINDGKTLLAGGSQHEVLAYNVANRSLEATLPTSSEVSAVAMLPDGRTLAVALYGGEVSLWDLDDWRRLAIYEEPVRGAKATYFFGLSTTPDGAAVISAGSGGHLKIWPTSLARGR